MDEHLRQLVSDPSRNEAELVDAIARLGQATEPSGFWAGLANSDEHGAIQRRHYVFQLFHRHVTPGMRLSRLAELLDAPRWLDRGDIEVIEDLGGTVPVRMTADDTVFKLRIAPGRELPDTWAIYLRVAGKITGDELYALLREQAGDEATALAEILEIGFSPPTVQSVPKTRTR